MEEVIRISERIGSKKEITVSEAKEILEKIENPNPFQVRTLQYITKFSKVEPTKVVELVNKLISEFEIERRDAIEVVNCMPSSIEELRIFFSVGRKRLIITTQLEKMLKILDEYR